jgi:hypothetical protein
MITEAPGWAALHEIKVLRPKDDSFLLSPAPPVLLHPLPGEGLIHTGTLQLSWMNSLTTDSSWLQLAYDHTFETLSLNIRQKDSSYQMFNIFQDTSQYWRVRQKNDAGWGPWSVSGKFTRQDATIIESPAFDHLVNVYPNPFNNELVIEFRTTANVTAIEVYNMIGEKVLIGAENRDGTRISINIDYPGLLILRIQFDDGIVLVKKLVSH